MPGYLDNMRIMDILNGLSLSSEAARAGENLRLCYEALVSHAIVPADEMALIDAWLTDLAAMGR